MWPLSQRCRRLCLVLLLTLWTVGRSRAGQPQPSAVSAAPDPQVSGRLIVQEVTTKVESLISKLASRIEGFDLRLINLDSRLNSIEARLTALDFKQDTFDSSLHDHSSRIESAESKLDSGLVPLASRMSSMEVKLDRLLSRANTTVERLDSGLGPLTSRLNFTDARLGKLGSRFEELVSEVNGTSVEQSARLDGVSSRLEQLSSSLDGLANLTGTYHPPLRDCSELLPRARSGIYQLQLDLEPSQPPVFAYCDLETDGGGWTVIQRRRDIQPRQDFNLNWGDYREGFGDLHGEFWWGLQNMWKLTGSKKRRYELRVNLADFEEWRRYATYSRFRVGSEADGYRLTVSGYSGTAGDYFGRHTSHIFSTKDRDTDRYSWSGTKCAQKNKGGWWFFDCYAAFLNGPYLYGQRAKREGIQWGSTRGGVWHSLKETEMKIRPV